MFTAKVTAEGYMIYYHGKPLGGAGIRGEYKGRFRAEQIKGYREQAKKVIERLEAGSGPWHMQDTLKKIHEEETKYDSL